MTDEERRDLSELIYRARVAFNRLCIIVSDTSCSSGSQADLVAGSRAGSRAGSAVEGSVAERDEDDIAEQGRGDRDASMAVSMHAGKRALGYIADTLKPNTHVGIHYPAFAKEYAMAVNHNTLTGENEHR